MDSVNKPVGSIEVPADASEAKERRSFPFYRNYYDSISKLPECMQLPLYVSIILYALDGTEPDFSPYENAWMYEAIWNTIVFSIDSSRKGGPPIGSHNNPNGRRGKETNPELTKTNPELTQQKNRNINKNNKGNENISLTFPYSSQLFMTTWEELRKQPKWKKKTQNALQLSLNKLGKYEESFAITLMEDAIEAGWQRVVFDDTSTKYLAWQQSQKGKHIVNQTPADCGGWNGRTFEQNI